MLQQTDFSKTIAQHTRSTEISRSVVIILFFCLWYPGMIVMAEATHPRADPHRETSEETETGTRGEGFIFLGTAFLLTVCFCVMWL